MNIERAGPCCEAMLRVKSESMIEKGERRWMGLHDVTQCHCMVRDTEGLKERKKLLGD